MWGTISKLMSNLLLTNTLYFDGSHTNQHTKSGAGCVIIDSNGNMVVAAAYNLCNINPQNVAIVEATALCNGLKLAQRLGIKLDGVKGDNKEVIDHVTGRASRGPKPGPLSDIIVEIKGILNAINIEPLMIQVISREGNGVADSLASHGSILLVESKVYHTEDELPAETARHLRQEKSLNGGFGGGGGGNGNGIGQLRNINTGSSTNYGSSSSNTNLFDTVATAGAAIAGVAMIGYGMSKLLQGDESENKDKGKAGASSTLSNWDTFTERTRVTNSRLMIHRKFNVLHVDGLDSNQLKQAAAGCIIRDKAGDLVVASAYNLDYCYPKCHIGVAEAMALKKGLELAIENNIDLDLIKVDNEEVFNRVLGRDRRPPNEPKLVRVIEVIQNYLNELSIDPETQLRLVSSEDNEVADMLANVGRLLINREKKYYSKGSLDIPPKVTHLINKEKINWVQY